MSVVDDPWRSEIDIRDMTDTDFQSRLHTQAVSDTTGELQATLTRLSEAHDLSESEVGDRAIRLYLAHLDAEHGLELRERFEVNALLPPADFGEDWPTVETTTGEDTDSVRIDVPDVVTKMLGTVVDETDYDSKSAVVRDAARYLAVGES